MSTLKHLKRNNKIALIFLFVGALLPQVPYVPTGNLCVLVGCNYILSGFLIIILLMYAYLLNCKNHIETLESSPKLNNDTKTYNEKKSETSEEDKINTGKKYLKILPTDEKELLKRYFDEDVGTIKFRIDDGPALNLVSKNILSIPTTTVIGRKSNLMTSFSIEPWAREYLKNRQHLLR